MANYLLKPIYGQIFESDFHPNKFEDRLKIQKSIYLLQTIGISVGDYDFFWYKHGPYSQSLQNDILNILLTDDIDVNFSQDAIKSINLLRSIFFMSDIHYTTVRWIECLASVCYLKDNILPLSSSNENILNELEKRKPYLNHRKDNEKALLAVEKILA